MFNVSVCMQDASSYIGIGILVLLSLSYNYPLKLPIFFLVGWELSYSPSNFIFWWSTNLTFGMNVIADDYDRSINEAIKITKYEVHLNPSLCLFLMYLSLCNNFLSPFGVNHTHLCLCPMA